MRESMRFLQEMQTLRKHGKDVDEFSTEISKRDMSDTLKEKVFVRDKEEYNEFL